jgi:hypothetical protein
MRSNAARQRQKIAVGNRGCRGSGPTAAAMEHRMGLQSQPVKLHMLGRDPCWTAAAAQLLLDFARPDSWPVVSLRASRMRGKWLFVRVLVCGRWTEGRVALSASRFGGFGGGPGFSANKRENKSGRGRTPPGRGWPSGAARARRQRCLPPYLLLLLPLLLLLVAILGAP